MSRESSQLSEIFYNYLFKEGGLLGYFKVGWGVGKLYLTCRRVSAPDGCHFLLPTSCSFTGWRGLRPMAAMASKAASAAERVVIKGIPMR